MSALSEIKLPPADDALIDSEMGCREVWGGCGRVNAFVSRPGLDVWVSRSSTDEERVSSDLHLVTSCVSGRITRLLLAELCCLPPMFGEIAGKLRDLLKRNVNVIRQTSLIRKTNSQLRDASQRGAFAATLMGTYFSPTRTFSLCNAGHPLPLQFAASDGCWRAVQPSPAGQMLGDDPEVMDPSEYQYWSGKLQQGDMLLFYTGALEERRNAAGVTLGAQGVLRLLNHLDLGKPERIPRLLLSATQSSQTADQEDATVILCRANSIRPGWKNTLLAPLRLLQPVFDRTRLK